MLNNSDNLRNLNILICNWRNVDTFKFDPPIKVIPAEFDHYGISKKYEIKICIGSRSMLDTKVLILIIFLGTYSKNTFLYKKLFFYGLQPFSFNPANLKTFLVIWFFYICFGWYLIFCTWIRIQIKIVFKIEIASTHRFAALVIVNWRYSRNYDRKGWPSLDIQMSTYRLCASIDE